MANVIYDPDNLIQFTKLGLEDLFWGTGTQSVERFGDQFTVTEINAGNMPFDESYTLQQALDIQYPAVENVSTNMTSVVNVSDNMPTILKIDDDIATWQVMDANATGGDVTSASFNINTNTLEFVLEPGPQGIQGIQGIQGDAGIQGEQGNTGATGVGINILGSDTVANILAIPHAEVGNSWLATDTGVDDDGLAVAIGDVLRSTGSKWVNAGPVTGPQGIQGIQGDQGIQGTQGDTGDQGIQGLTGAQGDQGIQGIQGEQGVQGIEGPQGLPGIPNDTPIGGIIMYNGAFASLPIEWAVCDGTNGTPNLVDKFIRGTAIEGNIGITGGSDDASMPAHTHSGPSHTHTMPSHTHTMNHDHPSTSTSSAGSHTHTVSALGSSTGNYLLTGGNQAVYLTKTTSSAGSHSHTLNVPYYSGNTGSKDPGNTYSGGTGSTGSASSSGDNKPAYYTLVYIMKIA